MNGFHFHQHHRHTAVRKYLLNSNLIIFPYCNVLYRQTGCIERQTTTKKHEKKISFVRIWWQRIFRVERRMFTQKSTLIFVQIEFHFFSFFILLLASLSRFRYGKWQMRHTHTTSVLRGKCHHMACERDDDAVDAVDDDDDGWRAFLLKFLCWHGIMRRYLHICMQNTWHTKTCKTGPNKRTPPLRAPIVSASNQSRWVWNFDSAICAQQHQITHK